MCFHTVIPLWFYTVILPIFSAICRIFVEDTPPLKNLGPLYFWRGIANLAAGLKKIEARFGLQHAGVENQKKPQVNILDCWLNTS
jgi:hypothetical protein